MTTAEHLDRIKARCLSNLALADKRTPGKWTASNAEPNASGYPPANASVEAHGDMRGQVCGQAWNNDAAYIAACAGATEAGWRSTIAAIETIGQFIEDGYVDESAASAILAAWPEELL